MPSTGNCWGWRLKSETLEQFLKLYGRLIVSDIQSRIGIVSVDQELSEQEIRFLLQSAAILSFERPPVEEESVVDRREWSYDVATRLVESLSETYPGVTTVAEIILSRLGNFPGRQLLLDRFGLQAEETDFRSVGLRLEALSREAENTIEYKSLGVQLLTDFQNRLTGSLRRSQSVSVSAPTSAGKSFVLAHEIVESIADVAGSVIVYVVPTRALIQQVTGDLLKLFRQAELPDVVVSAAPIGFTEEQTEKGAVYVLTQERLISLLGNPEFALQIKKVFIDEAQEIGDNDRGLILDSAIRQVMQRFPGSQICFASPLTKNPGYLFEEFEIQSEGEFFRETLAPVSQVLVNLNSVKGETEVVDASVITPNGVEEVGRATLPFKFRGVWKLLAETAIFVKRPDESVIVFANRPKDAMEVARELADRLKSKSKDADVLDLVKFVKTHVHPKYMLADVLIKGVAFHYGRMPHVIRSKIEELLRKRKLSYVVSTSTLLQGVNLPARHIVVLNPKQGGKTPMRPPDFWNLVGRAGRLRENFRGIVWCVDPVKWDANPIDGERLSEITSAFRSSVANSQIRDAAIAVLDGTAPVSMVADRNRVEQLLGKAFSEFTLQDQKLSTSSRVPEDAQSAVVPLESRLQQLRSQLKVSEEVCSQNAIITPTLLDELWERFSSGLTQQMIPIDPHQQNAIDNFRQVFRVIGEVFIGTTSNSWQYFGPLGFFWVRGNSLRELVENRLKFNKVKSTDTRAVNQHIRDLLDDIEQTLRFTYVKYLKAYIDVLRAFLLAQKKDSLAESLSPWDLFVEFGASDRVLLMLMSIGVSRSTALLVRPAFSSLPEITRDNCWQRLQGLSLTVLDIPEICKEEVRVLTGNRN